MRKAALVLPALLASLSMSCGRGSPIYPPRPGAATSAPFADPTPSRITTHVTLGRAGLVAALEDAIPRTGAGTFTALRGERAYRWERSALDLSFTGSRAALNVRVVATIDLPLTSVVVPLDVRVLAEPIVSAGYRLKLQGVEVSVRSSDRRARVADAVAGVFDTVSVELSTRLKAFSHDFGAPAMEAYARLASPIDLPMGDAHGCALLRVLAVEAGPSIFADGIEKDVALVVAPEVTLPCSAARAGDADLPALANVAAVPPGPFTVVVPVAARYEELTKALKLAFTDGKLFFSTDHPGLYMEDPEVYAGTQGELVLRVHVRGPVERLGIRSELDGDVYLAGHPTVQDGEVRVDDLEPTIETKNFFLSLKALFDGASIRDQAKKALRLDLGERLAAVRARLAHDLAIDRDGACFRGAVDKIEITGLHAHASYLRVAASVTGRTSLRAPCTP